MPFPSSTLTAIRSWLIQITSGIPLSASSKMTPRVGIVSLNCDIDDQALSRLWV